MKPAHASSRLLLPVFLAIVSSAVSAFGQSPPSSSTVTQEFIISPSGTGSAKFCIPSGGGNRTQIQSTLGDISIIVPSANAQPSTAGAFGVYKFDGSSSALEMLLLTPGTTTNLLSVTAATTINGSLTVNGPLAFSSGVVSIAGGTVTGSGAVSISGSNGTASGDGAIIIGGSPYDENIASGASSIIIGSVAARAASSFSTVLGAAGGQILGTGSAYSAIIGGGSNQMGTTAGSYNAMIGGGSNQIVSGGYCSAMIAGAYNQIIGGNYHQAVIAGENNVLRYSRGSVMIGGKDSEVEANTNDYYAQNAVVGGINVKIMAGSYFSGTLGGEGNRVTGQNSSAIASAYSHVSGLDCAVIGGAAATVQDGFASVAMGEGTIADHGPQLAIGKYNTATTGPLFIIGNGTSDSARSNAFSVDTSGNVSAKGTISAQQVLITDPADTTDISMGAFTQGTP